MPSSNEEIRWALIVLLVLLPVAVGAVRAMFATARFIGARAILRRSRSPEWNDAHDPNQLFRELEDGLAVRTDAGPITLMFSSIRTRLITEQIQYAKACMEEQAALLRAHQKRREAALEAKHSEKIAQGRVAGALAIEEARVLAQIAALKADRAKHLREMQRLVLEIEEYKLLSGDRVEAERRRLFRSDAAPEPKPDETESEAAAETQKIARHFAALKAALTEGVKLQEAIALERERLTDLYGEERARQIIEEALAVAGMGPASGAQSADWFSPSGGGPR